MGGKDFIGGTPKDTMVNSSDLMELWFNTEMKY